MPFILETHCDAIVREGPDFLDEPVVKFLGPFALQETQDLLSTPYELTAIAPEAVFCVGQGDSLRISAIPGVFCHPSFLDSRFAREGREGGLGGHDEVVVVWGAFRHEVVSRTSTLSERPYMASRF